MIEGLPNPVFNFDLADGYIKEEFFMEVKVCVGSSCHMKGSYQVIKTFDELIKRNGFENIVKLKASFCLGGCLTGIATMVDDKPVNNVGFSNAEEIFYSEIYEKANAILLNNERNDG